jgi:transcriptional regulator with XRE-family HTH domain|nr:MAG TPA: Repressor protein CI [Caudoviricetes sp.]DAT90667.1 MAG TPA: Repressor protein CI [Bacteriophage sp.]
MGSQFCDRVANNIKKYRKEKDMTIKDVAYRVGITEATMQKYEAGNIKKIDIEMLKKIADALCVRPENLTEWDKGEYKKQHEENQGERYAHLIRKYNQLSDGHKQAVLSLIDSLIECQESSKINS